MNATKSTEILKGKLKEFHGREWAKRVAERGGYSASWVRQCFAGTEVRNDVFDVARELLEEAIAEREALMKKIKE